LIVALAMTLERFLFTNVGRLAALTAAAAAACLLYPSNWSRVAGVIATVGAVGANFLAERRIQNT